MSERAEMGRFRALVAQGLGLQFDDGRRDVLAEALWRRAQGAGRAPDAYLDALGAVAGGEEWRRLAQDLTVTETYFFRYAEQLRAFREAALPECLRRRAAERRLRILSAGCASGEEAYSLAMLARDLPEAAGWEISIHGIDVNTAALGKAAQARYSPWSLRETPAGLRGRYFRTAEGEFILDPDIRALVTFEERNLVENDAAFWRPGAFDIVFCRNVIMYFTPRTAQDVVGRLSHCLAPGGFLFLGHAETLRGLSTAFHLRHSHETFYYQLADTGLRPRVGVDDSWVESIGRAAERIRALTATSGRAAAPDGMPAAGMAKDSMRLSRDRGRAIELLGHERYGEAQALLCALPPDMAGDPEVLLLKAVLLTHGGDLAAAEAACGLLLDCDGMSAGANYLMALCRENAGDPQAAAAHDQVAVALDPEFAMPRLHLGLLARRGGDQLAACRELGRALTLLQREDDSRLLLFGGGFGREALLTLCAAELASCGGAR